jgi:iron complex outermembrane receptor protein
LKILKFLIALFCALFCVRVSAQSLACHNVISGVVLDDSTHLPVADVGVVIIQTQDGIITDSTGAFMFTGLCKKQYTIGLSHLGSNTVQVSINLKRDTTLALLLHKEGFELKEVEVVSAKSESAASAIATLVPTQITGLQLLQTRGESLGESLKEIAGLNSLQMGPTISKPVINGLYGSRVLILNNGVVQYGQQWGSDHAPEVDPFIASQLSVIKGAASIRYGADAMAGVILMEPAPMPDKPGIGANVTLVAGSNSGLGGISAYLEGAFGKKLQGLSWRVQGTLQRAGNVRTANYSMWNTGMFEDDFSVALQYRKKNFGVDVYYSEYNSKLGIFAGSDVHSLADLQAAILRTVPITPLSFTYKIGLSYDLVHHDLLKASAFYRLKKNGKLEMVYSQQWDTRKEYDVDESPEALALNNPEVGFNIITSTLDLLYHHIIGNSISGTVGLNGVTQGNVYEGEVALIPNFRNYSGGLFWMEQYTKRKFTLEAGIRDDYLWEKAYILNYTTLVQTQPLRTYDNVSFTVGASYRPLAGLSLNLNVGSAFRPPDISELYINGIHLSDAAYDRGDTALKAERSYNTTASVQYKNRWVNVTVEGYFNYINNYIYDAPTGTGVQLISGFFPLFQYTQNNAYLTGINIDATFNIWKGLSFESKLAVIRAYNVSENNFLPLVPANRWSNIVKYDFVHLKKCSDLYFTFSDLWVFRQNHYPPNTLFEAPPAAYVLLNAGMGCSFPLRKQKMDISLTVYNLTNAVYHDYLDQFRYYTAGAGVNAMLRVSFTLNYFKN